MAKKRSGKAAKTKKGNVIKVIAALLAVLAVAYLITSLVVGQWNPLKWGDKSEPDAGEKTHVVAVSDTGDKMLIGNSYAMPRAMALLNKSSLYSEAREFYVTATLSNQYINGMFDWSASFLNSSSTWATGKSTDYYVLVEPMADGSATARLKYLAAFNEPIVVTATLRGTDKSDSCQIDCVKNLSLEDCWCDADDFGQTLYIGCELLGNTGTVFADYKVKTAAYEVDDAFVEEVNKYLKFDIKIKSYDFANLFERALGVDEQSAYRLQLGDSIEHNLAYSDFIEDFEAYDEEHKEAIYFAWYHAAEKMSLGVFNLVLDIYVNGVFTGLTLGYDTAARISGAEIGATVQPNVNLNTNVIF